MAVTACSFGSLFGSLARDVSVVYASPTCLLVVIFSASFYLQVAVVHALGAGHFKNRLKGFVVRKIVNIERTHQLFLARGALNYKKSVSILPCF